MNVGRQLVYSRHPLQLNVEKVYITGKIEVGRCQRNAEIIENKTCDIHSLPVELHEMILMSSCGLLTKTLMKTDVRPHGVAYLTLASVCQYFYQVINKRKWFSRETKRRLAVMCRPYRLQPSMSQRWFDDCGAVCGLTKLSDRVYVVYHKSDTISVYQCTYCTVRDRYMRCRSISVNGMKNPQDIASSTVSNCLYVADPASECVWKVTPTHKTDKWLILKQAVSLSVTSEGTILIMTMPPSNSVSEDDETWLGSVDIYSPDKEKLAVLLLPSDVVNPWHIIQTARKTFFVSHGDANTGLNRVCEITDDGSIVSSYGGELGKLNGPVHLALDVNDGTFVADTGNDRVLLLDKRLNLLRVLFSWAPTGGPGGPSRLYYDRDTSEFVVGLYTGHVDVYCLK